MICDANILFGPIPNMKKSYLVSLYDITMLTRNCNLHYNFNFMRSFIWPLCKCYYTEDIGTHFGTQTPSRVLHLLYFLRLYEHLSHPIVVPKELSISDLNISWFVFFHFPNRWSHHTCFPPPPPPPWKNWFCFYNAGEIYLERKLKSPSSFAFVMYFMLWQPL